MDPLRRAHLACLAHVLRLIRAGGREGNREIDSALCGKLPDRRKYVGVSDFHATCTADFDEDFGADPTVRIVREAKRELMSRELANITPTPVPMRPASTDDTREIPIPQELIDSTRRTA